MMTVFRIEREKHLERALSGLGASLAEGFRWNSLGTRLVYTAESRALAVLEVSVHLDISEDLPTDRYYLEIEIPDDIAMQEVHVRDLPAAWNAYPPQLGTQAIGDDFVQESSAAVLKVPSSIVPQEFNYLINPLHPQARKIKVRKTTPMVFDTRIKR